jgi:hypothetical protein
MNIKTIALAGIFGLANTLAFAQTSQGKAGSDNGPTSNTPTTQNQGTAGRQGRLLAVVEGRKHPRRQYRRSGGKEGRCDHAGGTMKK